MCLLYSMTGERFMRAHSTQSCSLRSTVYSWGANGYFQLGLGPAADDPSYPSPQLVEYLGNNKIVRLLLSGRIS